MSQRLVSDSVYDTRNEIKKSNREKQKFYGKPVEHSSGPLLPRKTEFCWPFFRTGNILSIQEAATSAPIRNPSKCDKNLVAFGSGLS